MEVHSNKCLPWETRTIPNKQPKLSPKGTRKRIKKKKKKTHKVSRRNPKDQSRNKLKTKQ